jgi:hypothetical protein
MQDIICDYITKNYEKIIDDGTIKDIVVELYDNSENNYTYKIHITIQHNKGHIYLFDDKLEIIYYTDRILYKNLYRGVSNIPIINITPLDSLGNAIKKYFENIESK